jgi:nudix motif 8
MTISSGDKERDLHHLVNNFTAPALAAALRDRDETLRVCARLAAQGEDGALRELLKPYQTSKLRAQTARSSVAAWGAELFGAAHCEEMRRRLQRMPRQLTKATAKRASVLIPLCHYRGAPAVLFTNRSDAVGTHKREVCFPGGMVDTTDRSIIETGLRELHEEIGIDKQQVDVLGVMRCDWSEVASITGVGVTPVLGYIGELSTLQLQPSAEVAGWFAVPIADIIDAQNWVLRDFSAPVFTGGAPHVVWGLTAYLLANVVRSVLGGEVGAEPVKNMGF